MEAPNGHKNTQQPPSRSSPSRSLADRATILLVDDLPQNIQILDEILHADYELLAATDGQTALALIDERLPDLVLLDVMMPGMDGFAVCRAIKAHAKTRDLPVIFLTSRDDMDALATAFKLGAADYVTKPFHRDELSLRVANQLELNRARKKLQATVQVLSNEMRFARDKQQRMLPECLNSLTDLEVVVKYLPYVDIGGDYYDIIQLKPGVIRVFIADAEGHGLGSALVSIAIKAEYENLRTLVSEPDQVLNLLQSGFQAKFSNLHTSFTCVVADLYLKTNQIVFASAGHPHQCMARPGVGLRLMHIEAPPVGFFPDFKYRSEVYQYEPDDRLLFFSDGAYEQFNEAGDMFGMEKLHTLFLEHASSGMAPVTDIILDELNRFRGSHSRQDDLTLFGIERT